MPRAHHRTAAPSGPDALDWFDAARAVEDEFDCTVVLRCHTSRPDGGQLEVMAYRFDGAARLGLSKHALPFPNTRFQGFWPSAYLLLHRVSEDLHNAAYAPARKHVGR